MTQKMTLKVGTYVMKKKNPVTAVWYVDFLFLLRNDPIRVILLFCRSTLNVYKNSTLRNFFPEKHVLYHKMKLHRGRGTRTVMYREYYALKLVKKYMHFK